MSNRLFIESDVYLGKSTSPPLYIDSDAVLEKGLGLYVSSDAVLQKAPPGEGWLDLRPSKKHIKQMRRQKPFWEGKVSKWLSGLFGKKTRTPAKRRVVKKERKGKSTREFSKIPFMRTQGRPTAEELKALKIAKDKKDKALALKKLQGFKTPSLKEIAAQKKKVEGLKTTTEVAMPPSKVRPKTTKELTDILTRKRMPVKPRGR